MIKFKWETEFKQTEIGEVPREWEIKKIEEIANVLTGGTPSRKNKEYWGGDINWVKSQEVRKYFIWETEEKITEKGMRKSNAKRIYPPNTVLIALYGATAGEVALLKVPATVNQAIAALEGHKASNLFLFHLLLANKERLKDVSIGSAQQNLYLKDIKNFEVVLPPANDEQSRIATVLSWFDDLIENKKRQNEILEKTAMAIFKSWFVDFEPFKDEEFVDSELGRVPEGWEVKAIGEVAEFVKGLSYRSNELVDNLTEGEIFITLKIFKRGGGFRPEYKYYRGNRYSDEQVVYDGDLVIALTDMTSDAKVVGAPALVILPPDRNKGILSLDAAKLNAPQYMKEYVYLYLKDSQEENSTFANGVNVLHLNLNLFKVGKLILIPPQPILQHFHSLVEPLFQKIILNQRQIMVLRKIRDALLPKLVFGKLRVTKI